MLLLCICNSNGDSVQEKESFTDLDTDVIQVASQSSLISNLGLCNHVDFNFSFGALERSACCVHLF